MHAGSSLALATLALLAATALAAQETSLAAATLRAPEIPSAATLLPVGAGARGSLALDSATIRRSGDSTFVFYAVATAAATRSRRMDHVEVDCAQGRSRGWASLLYDGERAVESAALPGEWRVWDERQLATLRATCGALLSSYATSAPLEVHAGAVDEPPRLLNPAALPEAMLRNYPPDALRARGNGVAMLHFQVDEHGQVVPSSLTALWATPHFAEAALHVAAGLRFDPARRHGHPVPVWLTVPLNFSPERAHRSDPSTPEAPPF
jgi:TonB family protein